MLVLGSDAPKGGPAPWVTRSLIIVNVLAFLLQLATGDAITYGFSLVPREFTRGQDLVTNQRVWLRVWAPGPGRSGHYEDRAVDVPQRPGPFPIQATLFSHMFLHAGWLHLLGNMWFLFVFGGHVERALRPGIFLTAYVTCGLAAGLAQVYLDPNSVLPCLGASGAISGVMGAYLFVHPFSTVRVWLWFCVFRLPALVVLGFWLLTQFLGATASDGSGLPHAGVAYGAHVGGFVAGLGFMLFLWLYLKTTVDEGDDGVPPAQRPPRAGEPQALRQTGPDRLGGFMPQSGRPGDAGTQHLWR